MLDYQALKEWPFPDLVHSYTTKDTILYALGLGIGSNPVASHELRHVFEPGLVALPTMAVVLGYPGFWMRDPRTGIDSVKVVHGEQSVRLHRQLDPAGTVVARTRVKSITDKGAGRGAVVVIQRAVRDQRTGHLLAEIEQLNFCRGDGGYSAATGQPSDPAPSPLPKVPERAPDLFIDRLTRPETALLYRLSGDDNPLHADPEVARQAGFERPILHGLATFGIAGYALSLAAAKDELQVQSIAGRFTAPVYPGETVRTEIWRVDEQYLFRARVLERNQIVLNSGVVALEEARSLAPDSVS